MGYTRTDISPANDAVPVNVASQSQFLEGTCRSLFTGSGGSITLVTAKGRTVTFTDLTPGSVLTVQATQINSSGTTATGIIALY